MDLRYKYLVHLRWYGAINYAIVFAEQVFFWVYTPHWIFWVMLGLNIAGMLGLAIKVKNLEKQVFNPSI